jgi:hypothetical protein
MQFAADHISFHPFVPKVFNGKRTLNNFKYRNCVLNIEMDGYGNTIKSFLIDGKESSAHQISSTLQGNHQIKIVLGNNDLASKINGVANKFSPQMPKINQQNNFVYWNDTSKNISTYQVLQNGKLFKETTDTSIQIDTTKYGDYQVIAVGKNKLQSFASEPLQVYPKSTVQIIQLENIVKKSGRNYQGFTGNGFVEISKTVNRKIDFTIDVNEEGNYILDMRYANGNGPINTENKCAFRTFYLDNQKSGTLVFPQRGKEEWSNWGWSNSLKLKLTKGLHHITISFENWNENMNGDVNRAMLDCVRVIKF